MTKSIEFTKNHLEEKVNKAENKVIYDYRIYPDYVEHKLIDLEDRSRRNSLRVDGILETPGETWEDCEDKLQQVFQEILGLEFPNEIERAHRTSSRQNNTNNSNNPRTRICNLLRYKDKV